MPSVTQLLSGLVASALISSATAAYCPPLGPVLPPPQAPSKSAALKSAISNLTEQLLTDFTPKLQTSGLSITVKSIHEDAPLFTFHYTPPVMSGIGTSKIDKNTIFRVGSLSKMVPALAVLQSSKIDMEASVLKYLPELNKTNARSPSDPINAVNWNDVTVGSLASHLSGISTDMAQDLALFPSGPWTKMGLPNVPKGTGPTCSGLPGTKPCTNKDLIDHINSRRPVYAPFNTPSYSNVGLAVLGMVIEAATGKDLKTVYADNIFNVAGMKSSSFNGPVSSFSKLGFVPKGETTWNVTFGVFEAAGGMFSSGPDIIAFSEAILTNRLLSPAATRKWMKPDTHTSSLGFSAGAPWEILRSNTITSDRRVVDIYTKSGDLGLYHAFMGLVPDYDIVVSVLAAGAEVSIDPDTRTKVFSAVMRTLMPAIEQAGREEVSTSTGFTGSYSDAATNSSITIKMDAGPGLSISKFTVHGFDVLNNMPSYSLGALESGSSGASKPAVVGRMYPTQLDHNSTNGTVETAWRAVYDPTTEKQKQDLDSQLFYIDGSCESWFELDRSAYNYLGLTEFVFTRAANGAVTEIKNPAFNVTLSKDT